MLPALLIAIALVAGLPGCGTLAGVGKDVQAVSGHGPRR